MAKMGKSMSVASRLAAATALTGTLAACDGRLGRATDQMFAPVSLETSEELAAKSPAPAKPGNPVPLGGSQTANDALYQSTYGAPLQGSGQAIPAQPTYADSVYQDSTIAATPITDIPGGPIIDAGVPAPTPVYTTESVGYSEPLTTTYEAPVPQYSAPVYSAPVTDPTSGAFPALDTQPVYLPQSSVQPQNLPYSAALPNEAFTDASADGGMRDIEPLLNAAPYGSTASHRYSAADEPMASLSTAPEYTALPEYSPMQYEMGQTEIESAPLLSPEYTPTEAIAPITSIEVASLGGYVPMPRSRPERIGPVFEKEVVAAAKAPVPAIRPNTLAASPVPKRRPVQMVAISGKAITDAPALTEPPKMIEVEAVFTDEPIVEAEPEIKTAALAPMEPPKEPKSDASELTVIKPEDLAQEMATIDTSKVDVSKSEEITVASLAEPEEIFLKEEEEKPAPVAEAAEDADEPRVEIASDVGDLKELSGTSWRLASLNGEDVAKSAELHFDGTSGFAGGQGICNNYGGEFSETLKGEFQMGDIFSTESECEDFALEKQYIVALESASEYRMAPGLKELILLGPDGKPIATFAAF